MSVAARWRQRPPGSNWGEFGADDRRGRMNLVTPERRLRAVAEVKEGLAFCLSLPLDRPGGAVLNPRRQAPVFHPVMRGGRVHFNLALGDIDEGLTDVSSDEAVMLYSQYSTHWDAFAHKGSLFDADDDGAPEKVFYNGHAIVDRESGAGTQGALGATALSAADMAAGGVQGRGVMVDLRHHLGDARVEVGHDLLASILRADGVTVEPGDIVCVHTGLGQLIVEADGAPAQSLRTACAVLDGRDPRLLEWITDSGLAAIASDNLAVERSSTLASEHRHAGPGLPLHEHCLFKLGVHLGELWYLTELAQWLRAHGRHRFLLTAPPLRLPGAAGSPVTPIATV
jgi:kynurenine formamidase